MEDRIKQILNNIKTWWNKFTTGQKTGIVAGASVIVFGFVILVAVMSRTRYTTLLTCETAADASKAVEVLESNNIVYKVSTNGLVISVDSTQLSEANLALGGEGILPSSYSLSDYLSTSLSTTASDKEKFYKEYMEKTLEKDISALSNVEKASVHLNIPEDKGTLIQTNQVSSAYIQLELSGTFTSAQAANLAKAVATSLGDTTTANITIIDQDSNMLFSGGDDYSSSGIASSLQELQNQAEAMVANQVKTVLYGTNQYDNVEVTSHLSMDFANYEETVSEYYPNNGREEGMYSHYENYESEAENTSGDVPGTDSNGENLTTYVYEDSDQSSSSTSETSIDYLPNQSIVNKITPAGGINYNTSSVSITAIRYNKLREEDAKTQGLLDGISWDEYKLANSADRKLEIDEDFYNVVANATGIEPERITIVAYESPLFIDKESVQISWTNVLSIVMFVIILALLAIVVLRSMQARSNVSEEEELSVESLLQSTPEQELEDIDVEAKSETRKLVEKFVDENPEAAAALLRNWLNEDWN
ncbi:MAG: flagellar M-ring protein FliF [Acetatifactor sp.]|nr:flagellar M-ring protein FliF [Acetatifactor sp.]